MSTPDPLTEQAIEEVSEKCFACGDCIAASCGCTCHRGANQPVLARRNQNAGQLAPPEVVAYMRGLEAELSAARADEWLEKAAEEIAEEERLVLVDPPDGWVPKKEWVLRILRKHRDAR